MCFAYLFHVRFIYIIDLTMAYGIGVLECQLPAIYNTGKILSPSKQKVREQSVSF